MTADPLRALVEKWRTLAASSEINALEADSVGLHENARISEKRTAVMLECADELSAALLQAGVVGEASFWITPADLNRANHEGDNVIACPATGDAPSDAIFLYLAAAPAGGDALRLLVKEMREALEGVVRVADRQTDEFDRARAAITRADHVFVNAGDSEAQFISDSRDLNCPACGGSGHVDDAAPAVVVDEAMVERAYSHWNGTHPETSSEESDRAWLRAVLAAALGQEVGK